MTVTAPAKSLPACGGNYVLPIQDPTSGDWIAIDCPGCADCSTQARLDRLAAAPLPADPFAGVPTYVIDEEW